MKWKNPKREHLLAHSKFIIVCKQEEKQQPVEALYAYIGSHNATAAAWGSFSEYRIHIFLKEII